MRIQFPLMVCAVAGIFMIIQNFIPTLTPVNQRVLDYLQIVVAFSIVLGVVSVVHRHGMNLRRRGPERKRGKNWVYSLAAILSMLLMIVAGFAGNRERGSLFQNLFNAVLLPVQSTMFALLAFYLASAAFRAFRTRSVDATVLLVSAIVVMIGRLDDGAALGIPRLSRWILEAPNLVAKRAILIGVGLGMTSTALKILLGIERSYLGSGRD